MHLQKSHLIIQTKFALAAVITFLMTHAGAQPNNSYFFRYITREDGLKHNEVYDITQDKRGFMWIVTQNGLQRYDGTRFISFNDVLNNPSQSSDHAANIYADNIHNEIWINNFINTEKIDVAKTQFTNYTSEDLLHQLSNIYQAYIDTNGQSWKLNNRCAFIYDNNDKLYHLAGFSSNATVHGLSNIFVTNNNTHETWMGGNTTGLILFNGNTHKVYNTTCNPLHNNVLNAFEKKFGKNRYPVSKLMLDNNNNLWVATFSNVFYKFDAAKDQLVSYSLTSIIQQSAKQAGELTAAIVTGFFQDTHNTIWITTENAGLLRYNADKNAFDIITVNNKNNNNLSDCKIYSIFQDKEEDIWLATNKGIMLFNPYRQFFKTVQHEENNKTSLPKNIIVSYFQTSSGDILTGTWGGGITVFDSNWNFKRNISFKKPFELNMVWCFAQNDDGNTWAGCQHGFILICDPVTAKTKTIHPAELNNSTIRCMAKDKAGNIWFGLHNGKIAEWNKEENKFYSYNDAIDKSNTVYAPVTNIFFDDKQRCWASSENGFSLFDTRQKIYTATYHTKKNSISSGSTNGVEQLNDSLLLIGTVNGGLDLFNINAKTFSKIYLQDSLQNVYAIKKDANGFIWFTTDYGLYKFRYGSNNMIAYKLENETINSSFWNANFCTLQNGQWIVATSTEILCFKPSGDVINNKTPVQITGLKIFDSTIAVDSFLQFNKPLQLSYKQNFLNIEWAKPDFFNFYQNQFYYRLKGIDKDWVNAEGKYFAAYTNLEPGDYIFEVKTGEATAVSSSASFSIVIAPPFWRTWWFEVVTIACCAALIYLLIQWRIKSIKAVEREKAKVQEAKIEMLSMNEKLSLAKLEALRSQMNPHFIFNCLTSIDNLIQTGEKERATIYLAKFAKLIRSILETSKSNTIACWKDAEILEMYLEMEELRCDKKFRYAINISDEILHGDYKVPPMVIQPFVENAIHHGLLNKKEADKELIIDVWASQNYIHYIIRDNGVGRAKAAAYKQLNKPIHQSMGMQITIDRINLFNQNGKAAVMITDLYDEKNNPAGTKIEVNLLNQS